MWTSSGFGTNKRFFDAGFGGGGALADIAFFALPDPPPQTTTNDAEIRAGVPLRFFASSMKRSDAMERNANRGWKNWWQRGWTAIRRWLLLCWDWLSNCQVPDPLVALLLVLIIGAPVAWVVATPGAMG